MPTGITAFLETGIDPDENIFALEDYYRADRLISEHAFSIRNFLARYGGQDYILIDPSTETKTMQNRDEMFSVQDAHHREGLPTIAANRTSIGVRIDLTKEYLRVDPERRNPFTQEKGSPKCFISRRRCPNLWRELTELQLENENGRIKYIGDDHLVDDLRYVLISRPYAPERPKEYVVLFPQDRFVYHAHEKWARDWDRSAGV